VAFRNRNQVGAIAAHVKSYSDSFKNQTAARYAC
jgi:hypothetical protein